MKNAAHFEPRRRAESPDRHDAFLHPTWHSFIRYCAELEHGQIEQLKIQDGLPVLAEVTTKKVKFAS